VANRLGLTAAFAAPINNIFLNSLSIKACKSGGTPTSVPHEDHQER
jgi:hypothetical protein